MIPLLPQDKANHFVYGGVFTLVVYLASVFVYPQNAAWIALGFVVVLGVGKEINDARINYKATGNPMIGPHGVEAWDAIATIAGGLLVVITALVKTT